MTIWAHNRVKRALCEAKR